jgi:hypothetical protein
MTLQSAPAPADLLPNPTKSSAADPEDLAAPLAFALRFEDVSGSRTQIVAKRLARYRARRI